MLLTVDGKNLVRYDVALYGLEVRNDIVPFDGGAYYFTAGKSRRSGVELGGEIVTATGVSARIAGALTHNEYLEYANISATSAATSRPVCRASSFDSRARYDAPVGAYVETAVHARDDYFADDANLTRVAAFATWDATVGVKRGLGRGRLDAFFGVANLLDTPYVASVFINGAGGRFFEPGWSATCSWDCPSATNSRAATGQPRRGDSATTAVGCEPAPIATPGRRKPGRDRKWDPSHLPPRSLALALPNAAGFRTS